MRMVTKAAVPRAPAPRSPAPRANARREDGLHTELVQSGEVGRREDVRRAKAFARIEQSSAFVFHGCASIAEYGRRIGYGSRQAADYAAAGRVLLRCPEAEAWLLDGSMCVSTLAIIEPLLTDETLRLVHPAGTPGAGEPLSDLATLTWARVRSDRELRRVVHRRKEEVRTQRQTVARTVHLTSGGADDLDRTRVLVSRKQRRAVSASEAVEHALRYFVTRHDLAAQKGRKRRRSPMPARRDGLRHARYVPAEVRRALMREHGDTCAIEFCEHRIWLENAHHQPHALGGGNELVDQHRLCSVHHRMKDHGEIVWVPDAPASREGPASCEGPAPREGPASREGHDRTREGARLQLKAREPTDGGGRMDSGPPESGPPESGPPSARRHPSADRVRERGPPIRPSRRGRAFHRRACSQSARSESVRLQGAPSQNERFQDARLATVCPLMGPAAR